MKFPHTAKFAATVAYGGTFSDQLSFAQANLEGLRSLVPNKEVDLSRSFDLLGFSANACSVGYANKNDDILGIQTAIDTFDLFKNRPVNSEHNRDRILGHLVNSQLSTFVGSNLISPEEAISSRQFFNISVGGVVYRVVDAGYAKMLEDSANPESEMYGKISLSFELGFGEFSLAVGSESVFDAEIISDPQQVNELKSNLRIYGGSGRLKDGRRVFRLIDKGCLPLGVGLTSNPAGRMETGLMTDGAPIQAKSSTKASFFSGLFNNFEKTKKQSVTPHKINMNEEEFKKMFEELKASLQSKKVTEETFAGITKDFSDKIRAESEKWSAKMAEEKQAKEKAEASAAEIKAAQEKLALELAETQKKLQDMEVKAAAEKSASLFSARMAEMDNEYELTDEDRTVLASDIKALNDSDESFAAFKTKMAVLMAAKSKKACAEKKKADDEKAEKEVQARLAALASKNTEKKLTDKELAAKALEEAKANEKAGLPNGSKQEQSLKEKYASAFSKESIKVTL